MPIFKDLKEEPQQGQFVAVWSAGLQNYDMQPLSTVLRWRDGILYEQERILSEFGFEENWKPADSWSHDKHSLKNLVYIVMEENYANLPGHE